VSKDLKCLFSHVEAADNKMSVAEVVYAGKCTAAKQRTGFASVTPSLPDISE